MSRLHTARASRKVSVSSSQKPASKRPRSPMAWAKFALDAAETYLGHGSLRHAEAFLKASEAWISEEEALSDEPSGPTLLRLERRLARLEARLAEVSR
jgi:phage terminase large subunit